jgi:hypothetical protein
MHGDAQFCLFRPPLQPGMFSACKRWNNPTASIMKMDSLGRAFPDRRDALLREEQA